MIVRLSYKVATTLISALGYYMIEYVMYQKTQTTDIGNNLNFEDEEFDFLVKVEFILHIFLYRSCIRNQN